MIDKLKKTYFTLLIPAMVGFICIYLSKRFNFFYLGQPPFISILAPVVFVLSVVCGIAAPIFLRSLFAHRMSNEKNTAESKFIKFEQNLIRMALVTPYLGLFAYLFDFKKFYFTATFLVTLYAVYYFYPSQKRIEFEKRIFRVK
ncbi:MAG: hypothetical protein SWH54_05090 [Thermodesulfobacteriota bacterium]|nr:hypothetical protein [Thermodesulfobacteriota bacterium]